MRREIRDQWTAALRSGEYEQATGYLRTTAGYCCLGVLCDLAVSAGVIPEPKAVTDDGRSCWTYDPHADGTTAYGAYDLPDDVIEWADLEFNGSEVHLHPEGWEPGDNLAYYNDTGSTFAEIADMIEEFL